MDAQPTRYRPPLATILAVLGLLAAPGGLRAELLVNAPPGARPWVPAPAPAARREELEEEGTPAPAVGAARPLLALMLALAIPPTMAASDVVSAADTSEKVSKVPTIDTNTGGGDTTGGGGGGGGTTPQTTPEPASLLSGLVGIGVAGAMALARRRRAARQAAAA